MKEEERRMLAALCYQGTSMEAITPGDPGQHSISEAKIQSRVKSKRLWRFYEKRFASSEDGQIRKRLEYCVVR